ncbi:MAG: histidine phosphatase family protein [Rhizobiaceae bacterium]|nr:histidine phosphatase family protein [Rhizobiaceae bacterium]
MGLPHLYLCRHGQTDWNAEGRLQGQEEIDLNALGRAQAKRNGRYLANVLGPRAASFRFLASPMRRTRETMRIVRAELGLDPDAYETDARLIELNFGDWQGYTLGEIAVDHAAALAERETRKWDYVPPGVAAESYDMLARRVAPVFESLTGPTILVAHGGTARSFLKLYDGLNAAEAAHVSIAQDRIIEAKGGVVAWV